MGLKCRLVAYHAGDYCNIPINMRDATPEHFQN